MRMEPNDIPRQIVQKVLGIVGNSRLKKPGPNVSEGVLTEHSIDVSFV